MINPQKGIDLMNNTSIINRILFVVTIFQQKSIHVKIEDEYQEDLLVDEQPIVSLEDPSVHDIADPKEECDEVFKHCYCAS
jgi:hypothetical protein